MLLELHTEYKAIKRKPPKAIMKKINKTHMCSSQMVGSHLTRGHQQQSKWKRSPFPTFLLTINSRECILDLGFCYLSRGNGKTQENCCITYKY